MTETEVFTPMQRLNRLLNLDKKDITQVYVYALFNGLVNLSLPLGIQAIVNLIQGGEISTAWMVMVGFVILGIAITGVLQLVQLRIVENIAQRTFTRASFEMAVRIPRIRYEELYGHYAPELANRFFDTLTIQKGLPKILIDFSLAAFQVIVGLIVLSLYHPFFILFGVLLIALVYTILVFTGPAGLRTSMQESKYKYGVAHWLEEIARTKLTFKLASTPMISLQKMDEKVGGYLISRESHFRILIRQFLHLIGFKVLVASGLLIIGSLLVFQQEMNIGQFVAAEIIIILIINSVEKLIKSLDSIYDVLTALEKIGQVTDMRLDNEKGITFSTDMDFIGVEINNLSFSYPSGERVLDRLNLQLPAGESLCVTGASGSGKSTLIQLLSGILSPQSGVISFNDLSLQSLNFESLWKHIGFVVSGSQIFQGSIADNISLGRPGIDTADILRAVSFVNLEHFLSKDPQGLNTTLDPEGKRIPGSVVNRIILARAIVHNPKLLILEDPLEQIASHEKEVIISRLTGAQRPWRLIVATVDPLWKKYIDREIVLERNLIVE